MGRLLCPKPSLFNYFQRISTFPGKLQVAPVTSLYIPCVTPDTIGPRANRKIHREATGATCNFQDFREFAQIFFLMGFWTKQPAHMAPRDHRIHSGRRDSPKSSPQNNSSTKHFFWHHFFGPKRSPSQNVASKSPQRPILGTFSNHSKKNAQPILAKS